MTIILYNREKSEYPHAEANWPGQMGCTCYILVELPRGKDIGIWDAIEAIIKRALY